MSESSGPQPVRARQLLVPAAILACVFAGVAVPFFGSGRARVAREAHDTLYAFVSSGGFAVYAVEVQGGVPRRPLATELRVFREPAQPVDWHVPRGLAIFGSVPDLAGGLFTPETLQSRQVATTGGGRIRLYAAPTWGGLACYAIEPPELGAESCAPGLFHGADLHVDAAGHGERGLVYGLVADRVTSARVLVGPVWHDVPVQRNALLYRPPPGIVAPKRLVLHDRDGTTHTFDVEVCRPSEADVPILPISPLVPPELC